MTKKKVKKLKRTAKPKVSNKKLLAPKLSRPPHLTKNSTVTLIAPAFGFDKKLFEAGKTLLEKRFSLKPIFQENVFDQFHYLAGSDKRRLDELFEALTSKKTGAAIGIRGGYGCARIYPALIEKLKKVKNLTPKIVHGYSDFTILLNGLYQDLGWITFHGPMIAGRPFQKPLDIEMKTLEHCLLNPKPLGKITSPQMKCINEGHTSGILVGGNLSLIVTSIGTSYEIQTNNKVLFLEDVDERPYQVDRMLNHLLHAGKLEHVRAIVFGEFYRCTPSDASRDPQQATVVQAIEDVLGAYLKKKKIPVVFDFPAGHGDNQITFPIGVEVEVKASKKEIYVDFIEPATSNGKT